MGQVGIRYGGEELTWDEARVRAEDPDFPFPPPLIEAMARQRDDQTPSASSIAGCLRRFELQRTTDWYGEANGELPMLFGTAFHSLMELHREPLLKEGEFGEMRLKTEVTLTTDPLTDTKVVIPFSGQPDFFAPGRLISDWKTKLYIPRGFEPPKAHIGQVNVYNWLAAVNGLEPAPTWELAYVSQNWAQRFQGETVETVEMGRWVQKRLWNWHLYSSKGLLPAPIPELFQTDDKGRPLAPCAYCPVREECLARLRDTTPAPFEE